MDRALRRELLRRWVRGAVTIGVLLLMPMLFGRLEAAMDPGHERREIAQRLEQQQRAGGMPVTTAEGEQVRAVVYTPTHPNLEETTAARRALVRWSRLLASIVALGLLSSTWRLLRQPLGASHSRTAAGP